MDNSGKYLSAYNATIRDADKTYADIIKSLGLSESEFWILYALRENKGFITQSEIAELSCLPPQTINTALKKLEAEGVVNLSCGDDRRKKDIGLTEKGEELLARSAGRIYDAELRAMSRLGEEKSAAFTELFGELTKLLKEEFATLAEKK